MLAVVSRGCSTPLHTLSFQWVRWSWPRGRPWARTSGSSPRTRRISSATAPPGASRRRRCTHSAHSPAATSITHGPVPRGARARGRGRGPNPAWETLTLTLEDLTLALTLTPLVLEPRLEGRVRVSKRGATWDRLSHDPHRLPKVTLPYSYSPNLPNHLGGEVGVLSGAQAAHRCGRCS